MPDNPLLILLDTLSPVLPSSLLNPLYSLASLDLATLLHNPSQLLPLLVSLLTLYLALTSLLATLRSSLRLALALLKWGTIATALGAAYLGYHGAGTDGGIGGGVRDAVGYAERVGRGAYSLGRTGAGWYFSGSGSGDAAARNRERERARSASGRKRTWSRPTKEGGWDDPAAAEREGGVDEFVQDAMSKAKGAVYELFLGPTLGDEGAKKGKRGKKLEKEQQAGGGGLGGLAWQYAMRRAKGIWDEAVQGFERGGEPRKGRANR
ncbi:hypothetical protein JCM5296_001937 [Sporobolomyces johnsonii]